MSHFDIAKLEEQLKYLESQTLEENFWNDSKKSSKVLTQIKHVKSKVTEYKRLKIDIENLNELTTLVELEPD